MIIKNFPTIKDAWEGVYFSIINEEKGAIDQYQRNIIHSHQNHLVARSSEFDFDLGDIGLTPTKWTKFTGQYVDVESLYAWVQNAMQVKTYDSLWQFKDVPPNFSGKKAVHQWGKCLLGLSFRRQPKPPTLTLFTRAQSIGFSGVADYALLNFVARMLAKRMGMHHSEIKTQVFCPNFILKTVEIPVFLKRRGLLEQYAEADTRIGDSIRYYLKYMDRPQEEIKWRAARRWSKKLKDANEGLHRSMPVEQLTLKGWHSEHRIGRKMTAQETARLVLEGVGRRGPGHMEIEEDSLEAVPGA